MRTKCWKVVAKTRSALVRSKFWMATNRGPEGKACYAKEKSICGGRGAAHPRACNGAPARWR
eukprot:3480965-Lingulodinium_polyedra.AAC.1